MRLHQHIARSLIRKHRITSSDLWRWQRQTSRSNGCYTFDPADQVMDAVLMRVNRMHWLTVALVVWFADADLGSVYKSDWLGRCKDGRTYMRTIADTAITATIRQLVPAPTAATLRLVPAA